MIYEDVIACLKNGNIPETFAQDYMVLKSEMGEDYLNYLKSNDGEITVGLINGQISLKINVMK